jgi:hypothetical protein
MLDSDQHSWIANIGQARLYMNMTGGTVAVVTDP